MKLLVAADFATPRRVPRWWWWFTAVAFAASALLWLDVTRTRQQITQRHLAVSQAAALALEARATAVKSLAPVKPFDTSAREFLRQHDTPWSTLLNALEAADVPGLRVAGLEYSADEQQARIEVTGATQDQILDYVTELNRGVPEGVLAWRWSILRIEQPPSAGAASSILSRWATQ
jgi:hypothetical protein